MSRSRRRVEQLEKALPPDSGRNFIALLRTLTGSEEEFRRVVHAVFCVMLGTSGPVTPDTLLQALLSDEVGLSSDDRGKAARLWERHLPSGGCTTARAMMMALHWTAIGASDRVAGP